MKAAVLNTIKGTFDIEDIQIDAPKGREVLVQVKASGLCHSDLHLAENNFGFPLPTVLGHELAGIVQEVGPGVTEFAVGDHVTASCVQFCGHCLPCRGGKTFQCDSPNETMRDAADGQRLTRGGQPVFPMYGTSAFAEYSLVHENQLVKIPDEMPFPQAALISCGTITGAGAVLNTADVKSGETVVVIGIGGVGLNVISGAKLAGAMRIIAVDLQPQKEALARKFGATDFINAGDGDPIEAVKALTGGGVNHAFEVIGLKVTSEQAIKMVRVGGTAYLIGVHKPGSKIEVDVLADFLAKQLTIKGVFMGSSNIKADIPMYCNLYLQGRFNLDDLISREINISEINSAYDDLKKGGIARSVITSF